MKQRKKEKEKGIRFTDRGCFCEPHSLYCLGIVGMAVVLVFYVKESNYFLEDNVIVPHHVEEEATIVGRITQEQLEAELEKERIAKVQAGDEEMESK